MGRKHRNASSRDVPKLSVRGVRVQYSRLPSVVLDMRGMGLWHHAMALSAALWCRDRHSSSVGVNSDPYGIWQACRFIVTSSGTKIRPAYDDSVVSAVTSAARQTARIIALSRGLTDEMASQAVREVGLVPLPLAFFWHVVAGVVGSLDEVREQVLLNTGEVRPVWMTPYKIEHQVRSSLPRGYVVVESGVPEELARRLNTHVVTMSVSKPHEFVAACGGRCEAVIAHSLDGVVLGFSANDRCYQVVTPDTPKTHVLMASHLQIVEDRIPETLDRHISQACLSS